MKGGAHPTPFAALSFLNSKKVPIYCWVDRVFQSSHGKGQPQTHALQHTILAFLSAIGLIYVNSDNILLCFSCWVCCGQHSVRDLFSVFKNFNRKDLYSYIQFFCCTFTFSRCILELS